jgi:FkbM family methyltransferase
LVEVNGKNKMEKKMGNQKEFRWGWMDHQGRDMKRFIIQEIFEDNLYERFFKVEEGDVVLDVGASVGPFTYNIIDRNPSLVVCVEPSYEEIPTLKENLQHYPQVLIEESALSNNNLPINLPFLFTSDSEPKDVPGITFPTLIEKYDLSKIDFLKTDCEGGEYDIFNTENIWWIKQNIKKITGEFHLSTPELKDKFINFRNIYLKLFPNHQILSVDGIDIKWRLWDEEFLDYYTEVIVYIDNR